MNLVAYPSSCRIGLRLLILTLLVGLSSCNTAFKNARKNLENGQFDAAVEGFQGILASKPGDPEVLALLQEAQQGAISKRLIESRMARLGSDMDSSLERLREVIELERKWGVGPRGQAAFTQNEEITLVWPQFDSKIRTTLKEGRPLKSEWLLRRFSPVFEGGEKSKGLVSLRSETEKLGLSDCKVRVQSASPKLRHHIHFLKRYCGVWGGEGPSPSGEPSAFLETYSGISPQLQLEGFSLVEQSDLKSTVDRVFKESSWFQADATQMFPMTVSGSFQFTHQTRSVRQTHHYSISETVTELGPDKKTSIQRQKSIPKEFSYWATEHSQSVRYRVMSASSGASTLSLNAAVEGTDAYQGIEHREDQPAMNLRPRTITLLDRSDVFRSANSKFVASLREELAKTWVGTFCVPGAGILSDLTASTPQSQQEERVFRCARVLGEKSFSFEVPSVAQDYMVQNFGLGIREALSVLGN